MVSLSGGPKAVNGGLHHVALGCHTSGIQWHHWETMLLKSKLWTTTTEGSLLEGSPSPKEWRGRAPHALTPTQLPGPPRPCSLLPPPSSLPGCRRGISSDCLVLLSFWIRGKFWGQQWRSRFGELETTSQETPGGYLEDPRPAEQILFLPEGTLKELGSQGYIFFFFFLSQSFK